MSASPNRGRRPRSRADAWPLGPLPVTVAAGKVAVVAPAIGQITFHWVGANAVLWQLLDEKTRATVRQLVNGAGGSQTIDAGTGRYLLTITGMPELAPIAVTVSAGRMFTDASGCSWSPRNLRAAEHPGSERTARRSRQAPRVTLMRRLR